MAKVREIEGFFGKPKEYTQEAPRGRKSFLRPPGHDDPSPISLFKPQAMRKSSYNKSPTIKEDNSPFISHSYQNNVLNTQVI